MEVIQLKGLTKKYDDRRILNEISISFSEGQAVAVMGRNGSGKSTFLKCTAKLVKPTAGSVVYKKPLLLHYVPEKFPKLPISARTFLTNMGRMDALKPKEVEQKIEKLGCDFFMDGLLDSSMKSMSKGTLQKVGVMQALLKKPDVLLLDEPLSGQDSASQAVFIQKINQLRKEGVTIFLSCHEQKLVDAIAQEVYIIQDGTLQPYRRERRKAYVLIVERTTGQPYIEGMQRYGRYDKYTVPEDRVDEEIQEILKRGWKLRGMYDAEAD